MNHPAEVWLVLLFGAVVANLPFFNERLFALGPARAPKSLWWRLVELLVLFGLTLGLGTKVSGCVGGLTCAPFPSSLAQVSPCALAWSEVVR